MASVETDLLAPATNFRGVDLISDALPYARRRYKFIPFSGKIDLFRAEHQPPSDLFEEDPLLGWGGMAVGGIEVHQFPGNHSMYLLEPVIAAVVAAQLGACLEQANKKALENATPRN